MIRAATLPDADWIAALWTHYITDSDVTFTTRPVTVEHAARRIEANPVLVLSDRTGFATYGPFRNGPGYAATVEHTIYLEPRACGTGQGAALLAALTDHARAAGLRIMVAAISGTNRGAVRFHARHGFVQTAHMPNVGRKQGRWLDLILMQKDLCPD